MKYVLILFLAACGHHEYVHTYDSDHSVLDRSPRPLPNPFYDHNGGHSSSGSSSSGDVNDD
jgi:hypothetical protein